MTDGRPVYGATTGFGPLVTFPGRPDAADQCADVLAHLTAGQGPDLDAGIVRATMLVRLRSLCKGHSGVSLDAVDALTAALADVLGAGPDFLAPQLLDVFGHPHVARAGGELRPPPRSTTPVTSSCATWALVATQLGNLAERQLDLLIDPHRNGGLPPMLSPDPGRQHALQGVQIAATAIVAAMRRGAHPASVQSLPTNLHNQDVVPFGTQAALNALDTAQFLRLLHGSLAVALRQAAHLTDRPLTPATTTLVARLAEICAPIDHDRPLDKEIRRAADVLDSLT